MLLLLFCGLSAFAQEKVVTGAVTDVSGLPLPGVNVAIKGTNAGAQTDFDGLYSLQVTPGNVLVFSFIGTKTIELIIGNENTYNIVMEESSSSLDEVLVVGYGTQKKGDITGSVTSLNAENFSEGPQLSPQQLIQGKMAGVNIAQNSGKPGGSNTVRIRGGTSISASNEPLYVIDGVPISTSSSSRQVNIGGADTGIFNQEPINPLNSINPSDIENITVLKDASATAIYGSRGANGVIVITTKSGKVGQMRTNYSTRVGVSTITKKLDMLSAEEFRQANNEIGLNFIDGGANTNWQDEILRSAFSQDHSLSVSGGSLDSQYRGSLGYSTVQGIVIGSEQSIGTARMNIDHKALDGKLSFDFMINGAQINEKTAPISNTVGGESGTNMLYDSYVFNPTFPVYDDQGKFSQYSQFTVNPVSYDNQIDDESITKNLFGNLSTTYQLSNPLSVNVNLGYTYQDIQRNSYIQKASPLGGGFGGQANTQSTGDWNKLLETTLRYQNILGKNGFHSVNAIAGYSYQYFVDEGYRARASGFISDEFRWNSLQAASTIDALSTYKSSNTLISYYGRINYGFMDRYLITATLRRDGSSRFGEGNKWGTFPSGSIAWRISNEEFFPVENTISDLKLRVSYGVTGNQEIGNLNSVTTLGASTDGYVVGGNRLTVILPQQYANPNLQWEETSQLNIGLDFELFGGRMFGVLDYYKKITSNLLLRLAVPSPSVVNTQLANVGELENKGFELTLGSDIIKTQNFVWSSNLNFSTNKNKVLSLSNDNFSADDIPFAPVSGSGLSGVNAQLISPGLPIGSFYGLKFAGIVNGEEQFDDEKQIIGNAQPDFVFGFNNSFSYNNFDFNFSFRGSVGNDVLNLTALNLSYLSNFPGKNVLKSATEDGLDRLQPKIYSSRWIEDGSFVRLDNMTLGYTFSNPSNRLLNDARIYISGQNLFVITNYSGQDPEVNSDTTGSGVAPLGIDYLAYPRSRTFSLGASINF